MALDILVANAGGPPPARALDVEDDAMLAAVNANLLTSIRLVQAAVPHMRSAGGGRICLITSYVDQATHPRPRVLEHRADRPVGVGEDGRAGPDRRRHHAEPGVPGAACHRPRRGARAPADRMGDPDDFGRIVAFLCSGPAGFLSGAALQVDGAGTLGLL